MLLHVSVSVSVSVYESQHLVFTRNRLASEDTFSLRRNEKKRKETQAQALALTMYLVICVIGK